MLGYDLLIVDLVVLSSSPRLARWFCSSCGFASGCPPFLFKASCFIEFLTSYLVLGHLLYFVIIYCNLILFINILFSH